MKEHPQKWNCSVSAELHEIDPDRAWSLVGDFFSLHKLLPGITTCRKVHGSDGVVPGCVRYCAAAVSGPDGAESISWANEMLVSIDPASRSYSYEVIESNVIHGSYVGTLKVARADDGENGCRIEWSVEAEPVEGWTRSGFLEAMQGWVKEMATSVADSLNQ